MPVENPQFITAPDDLQPAERRLFDALVREPARVFTKDELQRACRFRTPQQLDSIAMRLRRALENYDGRRSPVNIWGVGYRLQDIA